MSDASGVRTLMFRVGPTVYGCDITEVREIVPVRKATRLPGTAPYVDGLVNLRGTMLTVLDLGARLEGDRTLTDDGSIIVVETGGRHLGMVVGDVMDVAVLTVDAPPEGRTDEVIRGLGHLGGTVVIVLDVGALVKQVLL